MRCNYAHLKQWELGYLAGMLDAECHVGIQRMMDARRKTPAYTIRFELAMTTASVVDFVNSLLPTAKRLYVDARGRRLPYHRLRLTQQEALDLIRVLLPYSQGKRRQLEICLEIDALRRQMTPSRRHFGKVGFQPLPPEFAARADVLWSEFRSLQLNKKPRTH
jgi:hypothetical protein